MENTEKQDINDTVNKTKADVVLVANHISYTEETIRRLKGQVVALEYMKAELLEITRNFEFIYSELKEEIMLKEYSEKDYLKTLKLLENNIKELHKFIYVTGNRNHWDQSFDVVEVFRRGKRD